MGLLEKIPFLPPDLKKNLAVEIEKIKQAWNVHVAKNADDHQEILSSIANLEKKIDCLIDGMKKQ